MAPQDIERENRERQRRTVDRAARMTVKVQALGEEQPETPDTDSSMARMEQVVEVTAAAWAMTGQPWPCVARADWPVRVRKLGEPA